MKWIKKLLGLRTPRKKKAELSKMRQQAMIVQRNGNMQREIRELSKKIEELEDEIVNMIDLN